MKSISYPASKTSSYIDKDFTDSDNLDKNLFIDIYETYYKKVYNYISYRINNHHMAEDLVNMVFEKVIQKYHTYKPKYSPLEAWIIGISKNVVNDYFRSVKKHSILSLDSISNISSNKYHPEDIYVVNEDNEKLIRAMNKLKQRERNIISMKFATDLKNYEIASIMGISESNVGTILYRSMLKLRKELERSL